MLKPSFLKLIFTQIDTISPTTKMAKKPSIYHLYLCSFETMKLLDKSFQGCQKTNWKFESPVGKKGKSEKRWKEVLERDITNHQRIAKDWCTRSQTMETRLQ